MLHNTRGVSGKYRFLFTLQCLHIEWSSFQFASSYPAEEELENLNLDINKLLLGGIIINDENIECVKVRLTQVCGFN